MDKNYEQDEKHSLRTKNRKYKKYKKPVSTKILFKVYVKKNKRFTRKNH